MVEESIFRGVIIFLDKIGVYDIILPFLLVFTIVFAILEKTKVLGIEKIDGKDTTKKNINAIVAFCISFLVIASTQLVSLISKVMADVVLLLILAVCFLMLVGVFFGDKEFTLKEFPGWIKFFMILMFIGIVAIFLNAITVNAEGNTALEAIFSIFVNWDQQWAAAIIFLIIIGGFMFYITKEPAQKKEGK
ncbi:MAG: hypothetical protein WCV90_07430 [Candidatus Woesearchaeota archaeon]